jgi:hypothetical protein
MDQLQIVLDALETEAADFISEYEASEPPSHLSEAIAIVRQMMQAEPIGIIAVAPNMGATVGWYPGFIAQHNDKLYLHPAM